MALPTSIERLRSKKFGDLSVPSDKLVQFYLSGIFAMTTNMNNNKVSYF